MPLATTDSRRLYRQIADRLRAAIDGGEFGRGSRLPAERDLARQLGVSRPSVREALIALEVEGLVEVRMGSGVYVSECARAAPPVPASAESPLETLRARELIEGELASRAAGSARPGLLQGLRGALRQMQADLDAGRPPTQGDRLFHLRIAEAAGNGVLTRIVTDLYDERRNPLFEQLGSHFENLPSWRLALAEHDAVVDAIAARDADAARAAMSRHLRQSHDRLMATWRRPAPTRRRVPRGVT